MTFPIDNRKVPHTVTLTEGQISTILFHLEGAVARNDTDQLDEIHGIFEVLEGSIDRWYDDSHGIQGKKLHSTQIASPIPAAIPPRYRRDDSPTDIMDNSNYAAKVDHLVDSMQTSKVTVMKEPKLPNLKKPPVRRIP